MHNKLVLIQGGAHHTNDSHLSPVPLIQLSQRKMEEAK
jgi:hypothetical protein